MKPVGGPAPRVTGPVQAPQPIKPVGGPAKPVGPIPVYHKGGKVKKTGLAMVKKGETVIPVKKKAKKK